MEPRPARPAVDSTTSQHVLLQATPASDTAVGMLFDATTLKQLQQLLQASLRPRLQASNTGASTTAPLKQQQQQQSVHKCPHGSIDNNQASNRPSAAAAAEPLAVSAGPVKAARTWAPPGQQPGGQLATATSAGQLDLLAEVAAQVRRLGGAAGHA